MAENETVTTPFMSEEDYRVLLRKTKGCINAHKGHIIPVQTKMFKYIRKAEVHDMETIAEIQPNTLETLKAKEAKKGQLSPKIKGNEAITIVFKPGMEGNIYDMEGAIRNWAAHNNITGIRW